ncbi:MAG TPA: DUF4142 domain-containing protein [Candidatus Xenobia bacterium]|jgi:uncharacterized protein (DUF305 family)
MKSWHLALTGLVLTATAAFGVVEMPVTVPGTAQDDHFVQTMVCDSVQQVALCRLAQKQAASPGLRKAAGQLLQDSEKSVLRITWLVAHTAVPQGQSTQQGQAAHFQVARFERSQGESLPPPQVDDADFRPQVSFHLAIPMSPEYQRLKTMHGQAFDREFLRYELSQHRQIISLCSTERKAGSEPLIKALAQVELPAAQSHQLLFTQVAASLPRAVRGF